MLVGAQSGAQVIGYIKPVSGGEGFVVPVLRIDGSNGVCVQEISKDNRVAGFRQIFPRLVHEIAIKEPLRVLVGEPALSGFEIAHGDVHIEPRLALQARLKEKLDSLEEPFLQLQVAQFCDLDNALVGAWQSAFAKLGERSPRSANAWRDMVIVPAAVRAAVTQAALVYGAVEPTGPAWEAGDTQIRSNRLHLTLRPELYALLTANDAARVLLEEQTAPVRRAFNISSQPIILHEAVPSAGSKVEVVPAQRRPQTTIVAIGRMAATLVRSVFDHSGQGSDWMLDPFDLQHADIAPFILVEDGQPRIVSRLFEDLEIPDLGTPETLIVVFQLSAEDLSLADAACSFMDGYRDRATRSIAVIPHLTEGTSGKPQGHSQLVERLLPVFESIWILSDRSPHTRQSLPFGPARSATAASSHFAFMLRTLDRWLPTRSETNQARMFADIRLVASATGDRTAPALVEHGLMRMIHPELDFSRAEEVLVEFEKASDRLIDQTHSIIRREMPLAAINDLPRRVMDGGYGTVTIAVRGVTPRLADSYGFERFCEDQLNKYGWDVQISSLKGFDLDISDKRGLRLHADCKFGGSGLNPRRKLRRPPVDDAVLITTGIVRKRVFVRYVLHGHVPIHYSRIASLGAIYRRRFSYVMTAVRQGKVNENEVLVACIDWLQIQSEAFAPFVQDATAFELSLDGRPEMQTGYSHVLLELAIRAASAAYSDAPVFLAAIVLLDESGWHLRDLRPKIQPNEMPDG